MNVKSLLPLLLSALSSQVWAWDVTVLEGDIEASMVKQAVDAQRDWYTRAINVCIDHEYCNKPVVMDFRIDDNGKASECALIDSDIRRPEVASLFCMVAVNTQYSSIRSPGKVRVSGTVRVFGANGPESCHDDSGRNRLEHPAMVYECLDRILPVMNAIRSSSVNQYGGDPVRFAGRISVAMTVKRNGKVGGVEEISSDIPARELRRDVIRVLERLRFDPADNKAVYRFTVPIPFKTIELPASTQENKQ